MSKFKHVGFIITCVVGSVILISVATQLIPTDKTKKSSDGSVSAPRKLSEDEFKRLKQETGAIYNKYGEFRRVSSALSFKPYEIAYNDDSVNEQTKQLIFEGYNGVFEKVGDK
ncbi:hypothetical protein GC098_30075 [Paenibacillus sp. LMG 31458]|uniref:Uncharacterized protein n=1 Tax=Paenibacillus phytorum TaxID=2654977 RepID=A0ABX1Y6G8_9BACL|nr:hypothetical protein [Paenibacillus phytorum]NOU75575.1 hypothetical protein [Paenibacillus phytorum]